MTAPVGLAPILQVVPPGGGGVRDYMHCLGGQWATRGAASQAVALDAAGVALEPLADRLARASGDRRDPVALVLHFSGYGYAPRGLCGWLVDEVARARAGLGHRLRVAVVFHELFAFGPPWRSAFWVSLPQQRIAARLAALADVGWTNSERHARWLAPRLRAGVPLHTMPVFSNIGEPADVPTVLQRAAQAVVFGTESSRRRVFAALRGREDALRQLGIGTLVEAGSGASVALPLQGLTLQHNGPMAAEALADLLARSRFALLDHRFDHLAKSGVFAAYAAHGCVAVSTAPPGAPADGLAEGRHYLGLGRSGAQPADLERVAAAARAWYGGHTLDGQAARLLAELGPVCEPRARA